MWRKVLFALFLKHCAKQGAIKKISYHHEIPDLENLQLKEGYSCSYPTYFVQEMYLA